MLLTSRVTFALMVTTSASVIRDCIDLNGASYSGVKQISSSGEPCLNWFNISSTYNLTISFDTNPGQWNHSYCRNPDASPKLWCFISTDNGIRRRDCIIDTCQNQTSDAGSDAETVSSAEGQTEPQRNHQPRESPAVKPDPGLSRRVRLNPNNKKKDLGVLGYVLAVLLIAVILLLGTGITIGYIFRKGAKLRMQQEQRAYEQEMNRIHLHQSAFTNPACDLTDEQLTPTSVPDGEMEKEISSGIHMNTFKTDEETEESRREI